jgi:hypothetical protein
VILLLPVTPTSDASWYFNRASDIARGLGYTEAGHPTAYWPVGYPGFLGLVFALFGSKVVVAQAANLLLSCGTFYLVLKLTRRIFADELAARIAVSLLAVYPNNIGYVSLVLTEVSFSFLIVFACYLYLTAKGPMRILFSGLVFGLATLTKAQTLLFPAILVSLRLLFEPDRRLKVRTLALAGVLFLGMFAVVAPWTLRNYRQLGSPVLISTNGGLTLLTGNNPSARGDFTPRDALVAEARFSVKDQVAADKRARQLAVDWIRENPGRFLTLMPLKVWRLWAPDGEAEWAYQAGYASYEVHAVLFRAVRIVNQGFYVLLIGGFAASFIAVVRRQAFMSEWVFVGYVFAAYVTVISMIFSGQSRFHFPVMIWACMACGWIVADRLAIGGLLATKRSNESGR